MKTFEKRKFNKDFDHEAQIVKTFNDLGFFDLKIETSMANGLSHYVSVNDFMVVNENKLYAEMQVFEGDTFITVRVSNHRSNLDTICNGVSGNRMNLRAFKHLINTGAIAPTHQERK